MPPSKQHLEAAEKLKLEANALFAKAKYAAAIERYTEAITLVGRHSPVLFVNRAMAHRRREDWDKVLEDTETALELDSRNMKYNPAIKKLTKALEAARESNDSIKDEIWRELAKAKYAQWQEDSAKRKTIIESVKSQFLFKQPTQQGIDSLRWTVEQVETLDRPVETPSVFTCPLTMEIYRDPAITKYGQSYERAVLLEHLKRNKWDPITRQPLIEAELYPNLGLRQSVQHYLDEHPWAWRECY